MKKFKTHRCALDFDQSFVKAEELKEEVAWAACRVLLVAIFLKNWKVCQEKLQNKKIWSPEESAPENSTLEGAEVDNIQIVETEEDND